MPFLPASLSWAPIITMGSRPGGPSTDLPTVTRPLQPAPGAVMAAPRAMPGLVMPGVRRTPGRPRGGDARGGPDPPPCAGYFIPFSSVSTVAYTGRAPPLPSTLQAPQCTHTHF